MYWLMKSEPNCFSIDHLRDAINQTTSWDGVRNYQARNFMIHQMRKGEEVFFYHSNCQPPGIVGTAEIISAAYPDHTAYDPQSEHYDPKSLPSNPRWYMVDVRFKTKFSEIISIHQLRQYAELSNMLLLRKGNRLSILPVTSAEWHFIMFNLI